MVGATPANETHHRHPSCREDGRCYFGYYLGDKKDGDGVFRWPDGREYRGQWKAGKQHGIGIFRQDAQWRQGLWREGARLNWITAAEEDITKFQAGDGVMDV